MIKSSTNTKVETKPFEVKVSHQAIEKLAVEGIPEISEALKTKRDAVERIQDISSSKNSLLERIQRYQEELQSREEREEELRKELELAEKVIAEADTEQSRKNINEQLEKIKKLPYINNVGVQGEYIYINTNAIFTDIRKSGGEREKLRRCIGTFRIKFIPSVPSSVRIRNQIFDSGRGHWAISDDMPCLEEHEGAFNDSLSNNDIYSFIEAVHYFLVSDNDGGAYLTSHDWIHNRDRAFDSVSLNRTVETGDYVFIDQSHDNYRVSGTGSSYAVKESEQFGEVVKIVNNRVIVNFHAPILVQRSDEDNVVTLTHDVRGTQPATCYLFPMVNMYKITKEEFETKTLKPAESKMAKIDALPNGSTLEDIKELLN